MIWVVKLRSRKKYIPNDRIICLSLIDELFSDFVDPEQFFFDLRAFIIGVMRLLPLVTIYVLIKVEVKDRFFFTERINIQMKTRIALLTKFSYVTFFFTDPVFNRQVSTLSGKGILALR